jgi:hypothetical protein
MPILCQTAAPASSGPAHYSSVMALRYVGLDAVGPFRTAPGGYKYILVAVDKFTKWIEVRPVAKVTSEETLKFIGDIKHRFGVPNRIITDLGAASLARSSGTFVKTILSTSTTPWSPTHGATAKLKEPTSCCSKLLRIVSTMTCPTMSPGG